MKYCFLKKRKNHKNVVFCLKKSTNISKWGKKNNLVYLVKRLIGSKIKVFAFIISVCTYDVYIRKYTLYIKYIHVIIFDIYTVCVYIYTHIININKN